MFRGVESLRRHYVRKERLRASVLAEVSVDSGQSDTVEVVYEVDPGPIEVVDRLRESLTS